MGRRAGRGEGATARLQSPVVKQGNGAVHRAITTLLKINQGGITAGNGSFSLHEMGEALGTVQQAGGDVQQQQQQQPGCLSQSRSRCWPPQVFVAFPPAH